MNTQATTARVIVLPGTAIGERTYFEETPLNVSQNFAESLVARGVARWADTPAPTPRPAPDHGRENALAWFASIVEMVDQVRAGEASPPGPDNRGEDAVDARERITESALSVEVRSAWYDPNTTSRRVAPHNPDTAPAEYCILLSTGGPALRLVGDLSIYGEPETARLEGQNWGTPWTEVTPTDLFLSRWAIAEAYPTSEERERVEAYLLDFARQFYFGE